MGDSGDIAAFLADHDGVITCAQALELGLTHARIRGRVARGDWRLTARGLYRSASHPMTEAMLVRTAMLAHSGVADRTTAAWWHGLIDALPPVLTMSAEQHIRPRRLPHIRVDAARRTFDRADLIMVRGLEVTAVPMTVVLAAAWMSDGAAFMDRMLQIRAVSVADLVGAVGRLEGRKGVPRARELVTVAAGDSESEAERLFGRLLRDRGVTGWVQQHRFRYWRLDFAWPELRVAVEIHGWAFHRMHDRFQTDVGKANALEDAEWRELQYTWHQLTDSGEACVDEVVAMLDKQAERVEHEKW